MAETLWLAGWRLGSHPPAGRHHVEFHEEMYKVTGVSILVSLGRQQEKYLEIPFLCNRVATCALMHIMQRTLVSGLVRELSMFCALAQIPLLGPGELPLDHEDGGDAQTLDTLALSPGIPLLVLPAAAPPPSAARASGATAAWEQGSEEDVVVMEAASCAGDSNELDLLLSESGENKTRGTK